MTNQEAIKYLQQLYPNDGHCWLDEQRIEAIDMAVKALQEEPVSEELEEASKEWLRPQLDKSYANYGEAKMMELTHLDGYAMLDAIEFGAQWQKNHLWKPADGDDLPEYDREVIAFVGGSEKYTDCTSTPSVLVRNGTMKYRCSKKGTLTLR